MCKDDICYFDFLTFFPLIIYSGAMILLPPDSNRKKVSSAQLPLPGPASQLSKVGIGLPTTIWRTAQRAAWQERNLRTGKASWRSH